MAYYPSQTSVEKGFFFSADFMDHWFPKYWSCDCLLTLNFLVLNFICNFFANRRAANMLSHDQNFWTADWNQRSVKWAEKSPCPQTSEMDSICCRALLSLVFVVLLHTWSKQTIILLCSYEMITWYNKSRWFRMQPWLNCLAKVGFSEDDLPIIYSKIAASMILRRRDSHQDIFLSIRNAHLWRRDW